MAIKSIIHTGITGWTAYVIVIREVDGYILDGSDGSFAATPAVPYLFLSEHATVKGRYEMSESRQAWMDGRYTVAVYKQSGGSPSPASDTIIGSGEMVIKDDAEVVLDVNPSTRLATSGYTAPDNAGIATLLTYSVAMSKWKNNKLARTAVNGTVETWVLYDDDNVTPLLTWTHDTVAVTRNKAS
ncbi:MAG TPA: hypothetical protein DDW94_02560 [Deltaproteobacteria bacterium]|nr:MAG: hypothetical protein A2Z79_09280 [Deltaproteobacteria bacterium GWA2_55_82]OIJ73753.1 MAG: hypothetical protein A2V21_305420 [Deltaproteobacteria bacterium GWC2_55_46]HBG45849.1 hypothetical protein [Deltaproteobacteria bacterium]HCY09732.1 hypothetical protein [Deltaproteobacteria bacterium]